MKYIFVLLLLCVAMPALYSQSLIEKFSPKFATAFEQAEQDEEILLWIFFNDKGTNLQKYFSEPQNVVSEKSLKRRSKVLDKENLISETDLPVNENYINIIKELGFNVKQKSKWFNGVSGWASKSEVIELSRLQFVKKLDVVYKIKNNYSIEETEGKTSPDHSQLVKPGKIHSYNYGQSYTQLNQINVPAVHDMGYTGTGVTICMMDAGFDLLSHQAFDSLNIIAAWDFVNNDSNVQDESDMGTGSHGTSTLSTIGGFYQGELIGPAFDADFILAKTENTDSETPIEEDNWIAAIEWADSIGVDLTSTSLGYLDYDFPYESYTWEDMDGNTARITNAGDLAVGLGIVVVNSAGNNGNNSSHNTLGAPADGDSIIAAGAVNSDGIRAGFSSVGPSADGRIKPDLMAMGSSVYVATNWSNNDYWYSDGTSFSCPLLAGACALLLQVNPNLTPIQLRDLLRSTASQSNNPNKLYGWGIIDLLAAVELAVPVELISFTATLQSDNVILNWSTATETNNSGFEVERSQKLNVNQNEWTKIGFVSGSGTSTDTKSYSFNDKNVSSGTYFYRLKQIDFDGSFEYSQIAEISVAPLEFLLNQNYPNPFNPTTSISWQLAVNSNVTLKVYDLLGQEVMTLLNKNLESGFHEFEFDASGLNSGTYFYRIEAKGTESSGSNFTSTKKMLILK